MPELSLLSESQIQSNMLSTLLTQLGLDDLNPGSVADILTQAASQSDFSIMVNIAKVSRLNDLEFITGDDLEAKAFEYGLTRFLAQSASGNISILRPAGFQKVSTQFSSAVSTPISGASFIDVNDASDPLFAAAGSLILGRGTNNSEVVTYSLAPSNNVSFWRFILDAPLTNNHATEETVILAQGVDQIILSGTLVRVPANGIQPEITFSIDDDVTLFTGEDRVDGVGVTALLAGSSGNISSGAITGIEAFSSPPFVGARAENSAKFTTGRDLETDEALRDRVKTAGDTATRGVKQAVLNAIVGLVDPDSAKRVVSSSVVLPVDVCGAVKVYIDDGTGFEPSFTSLGFEVLRENSTGGEIRLQLNRFPVQKATVENSVSETFNFSTTGLQLTVQVGVLQETITFFNSDFLTPETATAEELVTALNDRATLVEARTSQVGQNLTLTARLDENESIQVLGGTANAILAFPTDLKQTLNIYLDDVKLSKDGVTSTLDSQNISPFNLFAVGAFPHTLTVVVDGKTANPQTATLNLADVVDSTAVTVAEIVTVINRDVSGLSASSVDGDSRVRLTSNTELSAQSRVNVTGGSLNDVVNGLNFSNVEAVGVDGDYVFNRELGIVELKNPLGVNQTVTGGSLFTRGKVRAALSELYAPTVGLTLIMSVDGGADQTITFDASFAGGQTAAVTAAFISSQLEGAEAVVRNIGVNNFVEIRTNTYSTAGSIEVRGTSTANASFFQFPENTATFSDDPNKAFLVSASTGPYAFAEADVFTVIVDGDIADQAFSIIMSRTGAVTLANSTTVFTDSALANIFLNLNELNDFFVAFTAGANTTSETITDVTDQTGGIFRLDFSAIPANFGDFVVGDLAKVTGLLNPENNGNFVIQALGAQSVDVSNPNGVNATVQAGVGLLSQKRSVTAYNQITGEITVGVGFANAPILTDPLIVMPSTVDNVVAYLQNLRVTAMSLKAIVEGVGNNTQIQVSSLSTGSDGEIEIPATSANEKFNFGTTPVKGVAAYIYWTGLLELVHRTIYGDDTDLTAFPGVGAAGIIFRVLAPTVRQLRVDLDVTLEEDISLSTLENEIKSQVAIVVNTLGVGDDLVVEEIRAAVIRISGISDVSVSNPSANVPAADSEIIRVSDPDIIVG